MTQRALKRKQWQINKSRKQIYITTRYNKKIKRALKNKSKYSIKKLKTKNTVNEKYEIVAPKKFSIICNYDATIAFFNSILELLRVKNKKVVDIYFDISKVEFITNDAIMYTLALIRNLKSRKGFVYRIFGNSPKNKKANEILKESGFYKYVNSSGIMMTPDENKIMICTGCQSNGKVASEICSFVTSKLKKSRQYTIDLYGTLIELMSNTFNHAYSNNAEIFEKAWYVYAEFHEDKVKCIFLDTGLGIAKTVHKKFNEQLKSFFSDSDNDCDYIYSAFTGQTLRTRTKLPHRGNGLPHLYAQCSNGILKEFSVFSGHAKGCYYNNDLIFEYMKTKFNGTLYYWEIY